MKISCLYDSLVPIKDLKPHPKNRNHHSDEQIHRLAKILAYQGIRAPIVVSKQSGFICKGHGTLEAIKLNAVKEAPVVYQEFDNLDQEYAFIQSDNSIASWAELDLAGINSDIGNLGPDFDIDLLGIKDFTLDLVDKLEPQCDEDEIPEKIEPITKPGDLWILGNHRLLCGDATNIQHVERLMNGEKVDLILTDPPYGVNYKYNSHDDDVTRKEHTDFLKGLVNLITTISTRSIFTPGGKNLEIVTRIKDASHIACWTKTNAMSPGRITHFWTWEPIFFYGKWPKKRGNDVFNYCPGKQTDTGDHTCPKPFPLWQDLIDNFSEPEDKILDLFGGSGTTLIACEKTNRKCFMIEIDPHYCDVIVARWEKYTGQKAVLDGQA